MRNAVVLIILLFSSGCEARPQFVSKSDYDWFINANPGITNHCARDFLRGGHEVIESEAECFSTRPQKRWKGVWNKGWEWSNFCPEPAKDCEPWFIDDEMTVRYLPEELRDKSGLFEIEFIGRKSQQPGYYGHLSQYRHFILIDRVIAIRQLPEVDETSKS